jgi:hypothetical protein
MTQKISGIWQSKNKYFLIKLNIKPTTWSGNAEMGVEGMWVGICGRVVLGRDNHTCSTHHTSN